MLNHSELHRFDKVLFSVYFFSQVEMMIIDARIQRRNTPNAKSVPMFALYLRLIHNIAKGSKSRATDNSPASIVSNPICSANCITIFLLSESSPQTNITALPELRLRFSMLIELRVC